MESMLFSGYPKRARCIVPLRVVRARLVMEEKEFHRRSIRIPGGDYSRPGAYFVTICAAYRRNIFGAVEGGKIILSPLGEMVRGCWVQIPEHFPAATIQNYVIMPNHLHGIIGLDVRARYI